MKDYEIEIDGKYRIKKIPFNYQILIYAEGGKPLLNGKISKAGWKPQEMYYGSFVQALCKVSELILDENLPNESPLELKAYIQALTESQEQFLLDLGQVAKVC